MKRHIVIILGLLLAMAGCTMTSNLQAPKISIVSVNMTSADVFSQQFRIHVHVLNPNTLELAVKSIEYELFLQGDSFAEGNSEQPFVIPAHGEAEFDTIINTHFTSSLMRLLGKLNDRDGNKVQYNFIGKIHLSKGLLRNIPFNEQGLVDIGAKK
jgi:LEA14-like dessication related protein